MEDQRIIGLFNERSENAITELKKKYGSRSLRLAENILANRQDAEETVSDAIHALWERIPPEQPENLWAYFSRILRNLSYSRLDYLTAAKRDRGCELCLSELEGCLPGGEDPQQVLESRQTAERINQFLEEQSYVNRMIFVRRYYYFESCGEIGKKVGMTRGAVNTRLHRLRGELRRKLEEEGILL